MRKEKLPRFWARLVAGVMVVAAPRDRRRWLPAQAAVAIFILGVCFHQIFLKKNSQNAPNHAIANSVIGGSIISGGGSISISSSVGCNTFPRVVPARAAQQPQGVREVFATLWAIEQSMLLGMTNDGPLPNTTAPFDFEKLLLSVKVSTAGTCQWGLLFFQRWPSHCLAPKAEYLAPPSRAIGTFPCCLQEQGVQTIFVSFMWKLQQPTPRGGFNFRVMDYIQKTVCAQGFKLAVVLDTDATPPWVAKRFPDGVMTDVLNLTRGTASFNHIFALELAHSWQDAVLARLAANDASCIHSIQPTFNNQYETKYTQVGGQLAACVPTVSIFPHIIWDVCACVQERDAPQDYSPAAAMAFREYVKHVHGGLAHWNKRWGTGFNAWEAVVPPKFYQHGEHYNSTMTDLFYWDWQHFRQIQQHSVYEGCCQRIAAHGFRCIMHFPEVFTSGDAIYGSGSVFTLAASPWLDYIIIDSNFVTVSRQPNDVRVVQLLLSAMKPFNKPIYFEGAFEEIKDPELHRRAMELTAASGAYGMGFTNWLSRVNHTTFFRDTLSGLTHAPAGGPAVAILTPYRSFLAYKGAPFANQKTRELAANDAQQDLLFACLDVLEKELPSLDGLQIFGVPTMLLPVLQTFEQVWYVEPDVLLSGDASTIARIKERAGALGVPLRSCIKKKAPAIVLPECCPSM